MHTYLQEQQFSTPIINQNSNQGRGRGADPYKLGATAWAANYFCPEKSH